MREDGKIDYVEFPGGGDLPETKAFYAQAFGWGFTDYGPDYASMTEGLDGGFYGAGLEADQVIAKPLVILYAHDLEAMQTKVEAAGGVITRAIFSFPGGRRFHFTDPAGNELGVFSEG
ncbi:VOC family protein [Phenylobacterium sp.]|uniref:VOC family protein n=1 Tax=Phenylobacterium sp. TaxID=1871053 RepID=UPI00374DA6C1